MYKLTQQPTTRKVGPAEAKELLKYNTFPGQRALKASKCNDYAEKIRNGSMRPVSIDIGTDQHGNKFLVNGQHSLLELPAGE